MPYCLGLQAAAHAFLSIGFATQFTLAIVVSLILILLSSSFARDPGDAPPALPGSNLLHIIPFFRRRFDFLNWGFHATGQSSFRFSLLRNTVIVVSGERARQDFFTARGLDLTEGFKILSGAIPMVRGVTSDLHTRRIHTIHKRLANIQRNAPLSLLIPALLEDSRKAMETWGPSGKFDPFDNVYELVFQLTIRSISCKEIADDPALVARLKRLYDDLDNGTTPATVLLPWLPTPAMLKKLWSTKKIYDIVNNAVNDREASGAQHNDALQMLLETGDEKLVVVGFMMGLIIAGARATGVTASWLLTFLGGHPEWRIKAAQEVQALLASAASQSESTVTPSSPSDSEEESLSSRLSAIPLDVWETQTPVLDALIRETTRVAQPHTAMRRNIGPDCYVDGKRIPTGAYVIYPFSDVHLDPELYPDPWKFDPARKEADGPAFGYVGWGGGKTVCLGTRLAKVELKLLTAMFVCGFEHSVISPATGEAASSLPVPNWNDILLCRPPKGSFALRYSRTSVPL